MEKENYVVLFRKGEPVDRIVVDGSETKWADAEYIIRHELAFSGYSYLFVHNGVPLNISPIGEEDAIALANELACAE